MNIDEMIEVLEAYRNGRRVQYNKGDGWSDFINDVPIWNFEIAEYRVKQEPFEAWIWRHKESGDTSSVLHESPEAALDGLNGDAWEAVLLREVPND